MVDSLKGGTTSRMVPAEQRESFPTRKIGDTNEGTEISRRGSKEGFESQNGDLEDDALQDAQPV